jgi:hypothetical protein
MASVHENQMVCGDSIVHAFDHEEKHHVLLLAQMQMGKSGTYWYVIFKMLFDPSNNINDVFIVSGNRETELHQQVHDDKHAFRKWFFAQSDIKQVFSKEELVEMKRRSKKRIHIIWGGQLHKETTTNAIPNNSLIVWDEAHYAQSESNAPDKFFKFNNLNTLVNGTMSLEEIKTRNIKLLTVSATPFSELVVNRNEENVLHKVVKLEPGYNYYGMEHYVTRCLIHSSFTINESSEDLLREVLSRHLNHDDPTYAVIRVTEKTSHAMVRLVCDELDVSCKTYNSERKDIDLDEMRTKPNVPTVIVVSGMLRMGKVIYKDHISMVFEASTKNNTRKIDTGFQGLLGRVCGYTNNPSGFDIHVYVEESVVEEIHEYLANYTTKSGPFCSKAMNTRSNVPMKLTKKMYTVVDVPVDPSMMSDNKFRKSKIVSWLRRNLATLPSLSEAEREFLSSDDTTFTKKDLSKKSNSGLRKTIESEVHTSYAEIPNKTCYIAFEEDSLWLVMHNHYVEPDSDTDDMNDDDYDGGVYVLHKCVFKA